MNKLAITLHAKANDLLFKHAKIFVRSFRDVIGHLESDYMSIALVSNNDKLLFFSSHPQFDFSAMTNNIFYKDTRFVYDKNLYDVAQPWMNVAISSRFGIGLSLSTIFEKQYRVVYSIASTAQDQATHNYIINNLDMMIAMGHFCLKNIFTKLPEIEQIAQGLLERAHLKLVVNNKASYDKIT